VLIGYSIINKWAVGVILYEFLNGFPPFNADTLPEVFENIIMRRIKWDDDVCSPEAREIMERLMCTEVEMRLGARGALEVKQMKWLSGTYWDNLMSQKVHFIPTVKDIEDTDYFDNRGSEIEGKLSDSDEDLPPIGHDYSSGYFSISEEKALDDDFGEVVYKNMSLLEKQNQMTASKISLNNVGGDQWLQKRRDSLPISNLHPLNPILLSKSPLHSPNRTMLPKSSPPRISSNRRDSLPMINSQEFDTPESRSSAESITETTDDKSKTSQESLISTPKTHKKNSQAYLDDAKRSLFGLKEAEKEAEIPKSDTLDILIAEQNPITSKIIETILQNQSARTIVVRNGAEAIQCLMGDIKYDVCIISSHIQVVSSEQVSKMIRTTKGMNFSTPLVLIGEGYSGMGFDHLLTMPITKEGVLAALESVGILEDKENNTE
jgi:CheY-like chemotaxis protein